MSYPEDYSLCQEITNEETEDLLGMVSSIDTRLNLIMDGISGIPSLIEESNMEVTQLINLNTKKVLNKPEVSVTVS